MSQIGLHNMTQWRKHQPLEQAQKIKKQYKWGEREGEEEETGPIGSKGQSDHQCGAARTWGMQRTSASSHQRRQWAAEIDDGEYQSRSIGGRGTRDSLLDL